LFAIKLSLAKEHVDSTLAAVLVGGGGEGGDVDAGGALAEPGGHLAAEDALAAGGVDALAVDEQQEEVAALASPGEDIFEASAGLGGGEAVEVAAKVDGELAAAQAPEGARVDVETASLDAVSVVVDLEASVAAGDEGAELGAGGLGLGLGLDRRGGRRGSDARGSGKRLHAKEEVSKAGGLVRGRLRGGRRRGGLRSRGNLDLAEGLEGPVKRLFFALGFAFGLLAHGAPGGGGAGGEGGSNAGSGRRLMVVMGSGRGR
jgi:hypothetical protein